MAAGTIGHCGSCHAFTAPSDAYNFISSYAYINGTQSTVSTLFAWNGGPMPPGGALTSSQAVADVEAWVAAGALDN
jgi:hypothetical protein